MMVVNEINRLEIEGKVYIEAVVGPYEVEYTYNPATGFKYVTVSKTPDAPRLAPAIYFSRDILDILDGTREPKFRIQTTSYGALSVPEIRQLTNYMQTALDVVEAITEHFKLND